MGPGDFIRSTTSSALILSGLVLCEAQLSCTAPAVINPDKDGIVVLIVLN